MSAKWKPASDPTQYRSKFECFVYEMPFIKERNPRLNTQSDSIRAKLFV